MVPYVIVSLILIFMLIQLDEMFLKKEWIDGQTDHSVSHWLISESLHPLFVIKAWLEMTRHVKKLGAVEFVPFEQTR